MVVSAALAPLPTCARWLRRAERVPFRRWRVLGSRRIRDRFFATYHRLKIGRAEPARRAADHLGWPRAGPTPAAAPASSMFQIHKHDPSISAAPPPTPPTPCRLAPSRKRQRECIGESAAANAAGPCAWYLYSRRGH